MLFEDLPHVPDISAVSNVGESLLTEGTFIHIRPTPLLLLEGEVKLDHGLHLVENYVEEMRG